MIKHGWRFALLFWISVGPTFAQDLFWKDSHGNPVPERPSQKSVNGVGGWLLVTPDEDWEAKWNTPAENVPEFKEADTASVGQHLFVLIFIASPTRNKAGEVKVTCDLEVQRPDHTYSTQEKNLVCLQGNVEGPANTVYLSEQILGFVGETSDPPGKWLVRVQLNDAVKHVRIPLETSFTLK